MAAQFPEFTVTSLTAELKRTLEGGFSRIVVEGEISGWRRYPSGHCYFTLKDAGAQLSAVMFAGSYEASCGRHPELRDGLRDGAKVKLFGNVSVYAPRGNYQFVVHSAKLAGLGELMQRYLELKSKLEAEGLFDAARKRPLPKMPRRIGIVTSEAGAVIHDMCTVLTRRFPNLAIRLFPSLVQGADAPKTIIAGIEYFNALPAPEAPDILIVARGGGSFEDLFCFNDEALVRAVAASKVPTVSAVGHETDYTLCDFAADRRAGTPSIAAEIAVPVMSELEDQLAAHLSRIVSALRSKYEFCAQRVDSLSAALSPALAARVSDTIKRLPASGKTERVKPEDLDRSRLWAMQTPQVFKASEILEAYKFVSKTKIKITDDVAALAAVGGKTTIVENIYPNPKITRPQDLAYIEFLKGEKK